MLISDWSSDVCSSDLDVRCVVLTGAGRAFWAGRDLKAGSSESAAASAGAWIERRIDYLRRHARIARTLHLMGKPTIAMVNGACAGAGLSLAGACDIRIAARPAERKSVVEGKSVFSTCRSRWSPVH